MTLPAAHALGQIQPAAHGDAVDRGQKADKKQSRKADLFPADRGKRLKKAGPAQLAGNDIEAQQDDQQVHAVASAAGAVRHMIPRLFHGPGDCLLCAGLAVADPEPPAFPADPGLVNALQP